MVIITMLNLYNTRGSKQNQGKLALLVNEEEIKYFIFYDKTDKGKEQSGFPKIVRDEDRRNERIQEILEKFDENTSARKCSYFLVRGSSKYPHYLLKF